MRTSDKWRVASDAVGESSSTGVHVSRFTFHVSRFTHHASRPAPRHPSPVTRHFSRAFTLLEVMIASGIFFMATFGILALVAGTLRNARGLQRNDVDIGLAASMVYQTLKTNKFSEGSMSGDFGTAYPNYFFDAQWGPYDTNGLLEADIVLNRHGSQKPVDFISILVWSPNVQTGPGSRPMPHL